jgi:hypothetical protein
VEVLSARDELAWRSQQRTKVAQPEFDEVTGHVHSVVGADERVAQSRRVPAPIGEISQVRAGPGPTRHSVKPHPTHQLIDGGEGRHGLSAWTCEDCRHPVADCLPAVLLDDRALGLGT